MRLGAGFDPAVTLNACALVVVGEVRLDVWAPLIVKTWQGQKGAPLDIRLNVGPEAAEIVRAAGLTSWRSDLFARDQVHHVSKAAGLRAEFDEEGVLESFGALRLLMHRHLDDKPGPRLMLRADDPELDDACTRIAKQAATVLLRRKNGKGEIVLPTIGGSHGDELRALVRALRHAKAGDQQAPKLPEDNGHRFLSSRATAPVLDGEDVFRSARSRQTP